jgi:hypothetical protein
MSERKQEAVQMIDRLPEEKVEFVIQYIRQLEITSLNKEAEPSPKMKAFLELEKMLVPAAEDLDYNRELAEARDEKYGYID